MTNKQNYEKLAFEWKKEYYGDIKHCKKCKGKGQLNKAREYAWHKRTKFIACKKCGGFGCTKKNGKKMNEV